MTARLLSPDAIDRQTGRPAKARAWIDDRGMWDPDREERLRKAGARYLVVTEGWHSSGRRYRETATLQGAQTIIREWARRRFYVEA
jgi:hypothetical protein